MRTTLDFHGVIFIIKENLKVITKPQMAIQRVLMVMESKK